jgi:hypothetical protein
VAVPIPFTWRPDAIPQRVVGCTDNGGVLKSLAYGVIEMLAPVSTISNTVFGRNTVGKPSFVSDMKLTNLS